MRTVAALLAVAVTATMAVVPCHTASSEEAEWVSLFDGETLEGWTKRNGRATYRVEDGAIIGRSARIAYNSFLCTDKHYGDFELEFETKILDDALNSGVQIRSRTRRGSWLGFFLGVVNGPQVEVEAGGEGGSVSGYLYGEASGGWMTPPERRVPHPHFQRGAWNHYRVLAEGPRIRVWINEVLIDDLTDEEKYASHPTGFIGLQVHAVGWEGPYEVAWRNLRIREISKP